MNLHRRAWLAAAAVVALPARAAVAPAHERPALAVAAPSRAVLMAGARAGHRIVAVGERGLVITSDDAGKTWRQSGVPVSTTLTAVRFVDERHGVAVGHAAVVLTTNDGGQTWTRRLDGKQAAALALEAARKSGDAPAIKSAERLVADGPDKPLLDVLMLSPQEFVAVGAYGLALHTADGGASFTAWNTRLPNPKELHLYALARAGNVWLIVGEQGLVLRSTDNGQRFEPLALPYQGSYFAADAASAHELTVAGLRGNVWRSGDAGHSWSLLRTPVPASITAMARRHDGALLFANQAGMVLAAGAGQALEPLRVMPSPPIHGLIETSDGRLLALGVFGVKPLVPLAP